MQPNLPVFQGALLSSASFSATRNPQLIQNDQIKPTKSASWTESKPKLEKYPLGRAVNPDLDPSDMEKLFREHVKMLFEESIYNERRSLIPLFWLHGLCCVILVSIQHLCAVNLVTSSYWSA